MTIHYLKKVVNRSTFVCVAILFLAAVAFARIVEDAEFGPGPTSGQRAVGAWGSG
jgi:hypothetical protein